jgi:hypothetical protein
MLASRRREESRREKKKRKKRFCSDQGITTIQQHQITETAAFYTAVPMFCIEF